MSVLNYLPSLGSLFGPVTDLEPAYALAGDGFLEEKAITEAEPADRFLVSANEDTSQEPAPRSSQPAPRPTHLQSTQKDTTSPRKVFAALQDWGSDTRKRWGMVVDFALAPIAQRDEEWHRLAEQMETFNYRAKTFGLEEILYGLQKAFEPSMYAALIAKSALLSILPEQLREPLTNYLITSATRSVLPSTSSRLMIEGIASPPLHMTLEQARLAIRRLREDPDDGKVGHGRTVLASVLNSLSRTYADRPQVLGAFIRDEVLPAMARYRRPVWTTSLSDKTATDDLYRAIISFTRIHKNITRQLTDSHIKTDHPQLDIWLDRCYSFGQQWTPYQIDFVLGRASRAIQLQAQNPSQENGNLCYVYKQVLNNIKYIYEHRAEYSGNVNITHTQYTRAVVLNEQT